MRKIAFAIVVTSAMVPGAGFAQQAPGTAATSPPPPATALPHDVAPQPGDPLYPGSDTGFDRVASDGISTKTVRAIPCSTAARETDGFTTCVGISSGRARRRK